MASRRNTWFSFFKLIIYGALDRFDESGILLLTLRHRMARLLKNGREPGGLGLAHHHPGCPAPHILQPARL